MTLPEAEARAVAWALELAFERQRQRGHLDATLFRALDAVRLGRALDESDLRAARVVVRSVQAELKYTPGAPLTDAATFDLDPLDSGALDRAGHLLA